MRLRLRVWVYDQGRVRRARARERDGRPGRDRALLRPLQRPDARVARRAGGGARPPTAVSGDRGRDRMAAPADRVRARWRLPPATDGVLGPPAVPLPRAPVGSDRSVGDVDGRRPGACIIGLASLGVRGAGCPVRSWIVRRRIGISGERPPSGWGTWSHGRCAKRSPKNLGPDPRVEHRGRRQRCRHPGLCGIERLPDDLPAGAVRALDLAPRVPNPDQPEHAPDRHQHR